MSGSSFEELRRISRADERAAHGRKLRALYRSLALSREDLAKFLHVSERTIRHWEAGDSRIPRTVFKLLRLMLWRELPGKSWEGWHFSAGKLWSPEGFGFDGTEANWWSNTVRRAQMFSVLYEEGRALRIELMEARRDLADAEVRALEAQNRAIEAETRASLVERAFVRSIKATPLAISQDAARALAPTTHLEPSAPPAAGPEGPGLVLVPTTRPHPPFPIGEIGPAAARFSTPPEAAPAAPSDPYGSP